MREPVGLFFAGGVTTSGMSEGVANPVGHSAGGAGLAAGQPHYTLSAQRTTP